MVQNVQNQDDQDYAELIGSVAARFDRAKSLRSHWGEFVARVL